MICPYCQRSPKPKDFRGLEIDQCECGGLWFDHGELSEYLSRWACGEVASGEQAEGEVLTCPWCGTETLGPYRAVGQDFHRCGSCFGIGIQHAALDRLIACPEPSAPSGRLTVSEAIRNFFKRAFR